MIVAIALGVPGVATGQRTFGTMLLVESGPRANGPSPLSAETAGDWRFVELVYAPLFSTDGNGGLVPFLAEKVTVEDGGKRLIVTVA